MNLAASHHHRRKGAVILLTTALLGAILPIVGLAIDSSLLFAIKARLSAASDAAALAGARALQRGMTLESQIGAATATAQAFFNANFPEGYLMTRNRTLSVTVAETAFKTRSVRMDASVDAPTFFMRVLGLNLTTVRAVGMASRRDVNLILLIDRSGSIATAGADDDVRAASKAFVEKFAEGRDRLGMISFSGPYYENFPPGFDFKTRSPATLSQTIDALVFSGNTGSAQALWQGYQRLVTINEPGALNLVIFFTDGRPTALTAQFPVKTLADTRYSYSSTGTLVSTPASPCSSSAAKLAFISAPINTYATTGTTWGAMLTQATSPTHDEWTLAPNSSGCSYASGSGQSYRARMRRDIAYIPDTDQNSNSTWGYMPFSSPGDLFPSGNPYVGKIRVDSPRAVRYAANNLADNIAQRIRNDASLTPYIFCIGLGGTSTETLDHVLLQRIANDPASPIYDSNKPIGMYVYAPTTNELNEAFARVASEILRLAI